MTATALSTARIASRLARPPDRRPAAPRLRRRRRGGRLRTGRRRRRPAAGSVESTVDRRRLEHRLPDQQGAPRRRSPRSSPRSTVVVDNHGTGGGFSRYLQGEVDIVDASRDRQARGGGEGQGAGDRLDPVPRRLRRDHRRRQPEERLRQGADRRAAQGALGARQQGQDLEGPRPVLARPQDRPLQPRQRLGDLRVLHRGDRRQGEEPARGRAGQLRRQHPGQRRRGRRRRARLLRLRLLRGQRGQAPGRRRSRTDADAQAVAAEPGDDPRQDVRPAVAPAVHLREELGDAPARGRRRS